MFSALRQNSELYIVDKSGIPSFKVGRVLNTKPSQPFYSNPLDSTVDITIEIDGENIECKLVPSNLSVAIVGNAIISETKELLCTEVEKIRKNSQQIIDSEDFHKESIKACDEIINQLNPQLAKEKLQEKKIGLLETKVLGIESSLDDIKAMLSKALN